MVWTSLITEKRSDFSLERTDTEFDPVEITEGESKLTKWPLTGALVFLHYTEYIHDGIYIAKAFGTNVLPSIIVMV